MVVETVTVTVSGMSIETQPETPPEFPGVSETPREFDGNLFFLAEQLGRIEQKLDMIQSFLAQLQPHLHLVEKFANNPAIRWMGVKR